MRPSIPMLRSLRRSSAPIDLLPSASMFLVMCPIRSARADESETPETQKGPDGPAPASTSKELSDKPAAGSQPIDVSSTSSVTTAPGLAGSPHALDKLDSRSKTAQQAATEIPARSGTATPRPFNALPTGSDK